MATFPGLSFLKDVVHMQDICNPAPETRYLQDQGLSIPFSLPRWIGCRSGLRTRCAELEIAKVGCDLNDAPSLSL
jgi:hypothetical protein